MSLGKTSELRRASRTGARKVFSGPARGTLFVTFIAMFLNFDLNILLIVVRSRVNFLNV